MVAPRTWTVAQWFAIALAVFTLVAGLGGLAINPDFAVGDDATAEPFLGVDWNGWHGVGALLVGIPGLVVAWHPQFAVAYLVYRAVTDAPVAVWAALDDRPLGVLYLPTTGDAVMHAAIAAFATLGAVLGTRHRGPRAESA